MTLPKSATSGCRLHDMRTLWPGTPGVRKWWADSIRDDLLNKPFHSYIKIVDTESADAHGKPRLVAYAKWDMSTIEERGARYHLWHPDMPAKD